MPCAVAVHDAHVCACRGIPTAIDLGVARTVRRTVLQRAAKADRQLRHERHLGHSPLCSESGLRHCPDRLRHAPLLCVIAGDQSAPHCTNLHRPRTGLTQVTLMTHSPDNGAGRPALHARGR